MENKLNELKELGFDITNIIEYSKKPETSLYYYRLTGIFKNRKWTKDDICLFSNKIYNIITKRLR